METAFAISRPPNVKRITSPKTKNVLKYKQDREKGFTLIEILVVLVILAILMTIAFVFLGDQGKRSRITTATSSIKSAMAIAGACYAMGTTPSSPPDGNRGPGSLICGDGKISNTAVWPELPEKCLYCGNDGTKINFECQNTACGNVSEKSYCDYNTTQCVQNN